MVGATKDSETRLKKRIDHAQIVDNPVLARHRHSCLDVLTPGGYTVNCRLLHTPCTFFALVRKREHQSLTRTKDFKPKLLIYIRACETFNSQLAHK
jgi:hypothetical protein